MNNKILFLLSILFCFHYTFAQDSQAQKNETPNKASISLLNKQQRLKLNTKLRFNEQIIFIKCHPLVSQISLGDFVCDTTDQITIHKNEVYIYLKNSFSWNLKDEPPHVTNLSILKLLMKKKEKQTEEEQKTINYLKFYNSTDQKSYIEKYECHQEVEVKEQGNFQIHYELKYDQNKHLKIVNQDIKRLENNYFQ